MVHNTLQTICGRIQYLRENTDFVSTVFDSLVGYAVLAADFDGNIIAYNQGAHQIYGYAPEEVIGKKNIEIFFTEEFIKKGELQDIVSKLVGKGRFSYEGEAVKKDGTRFPAHLLFTLTKDKNGQIVGLVEIVQDLTEQKQAEETVRQLQIKQLQLQQLEQERAEAHISTITDAIILLRYVEINGILRRGIAVIKMRGSQHDKQIHEFLIDGQGLHIIAPFKNVQNILLGIPSGSGPSESEHLEDMFEK